MRYLLPLLLSCMALVGCQKPTMIITSHCDLMVDDVCFDHTDGKGHVVAITKEQTDKVSKAIELRHRCAVTTGPNSPAVTGDGNVVNFRNEP